MSEGRLSDHAVRCPLRIVHPNVIYQPRQSNCLSYTTPLVQDGHCSCKIILYCSAQSQGGVTHLYCWVICDHGQRTSLKGVELCLVKGQGCYLLLMEHLHFHNQFKSVIYTSTIFSSLGIMFVVLILFPKQLYLSHMKKLLQNISVYENSKQLDK